jgi:amidase
MTESTLLTEPVFETVDLRAGYDDVPVLNGVNLSVNEGDALGIIGHNGMGKTTLIKSIMGLVPTKSGRISVDGIDLSKEPTYARSRIGIGYVPQGRGILANLTARDNLKFAWTQESGETEVEAFERVLQLFPRIEGFLDRKGGLLSGGEQQILAIGRALISNPWLLILDEPSEGIQPSIVKEIGIILSRLRKETGLTLIIVEQNLDLVLDVATHILVLEKGKVVKDFASTEIADGLLAEILGLGAARATRSSTTIKEKSFDQKIDVSSPKSIQIDRDNMAKVKRPSHQQLKEIVSSLHMSMSDREINEYLDVMNETINAYDVVNSYNDYIPKVKYPRTPGYRPRSSENELNAWAVKSEVKGASNGPLSGKKIVLKDNVCLAGVPMMNGASTLDGYVPDLDATIVTRMLDAGATIVGKAHCEYFCLSAGSHTNSTGYVQNPYRFGYAAGGSSSGSGALVGAGEVEIAIGGDQGGSIRIPSSFCGCYGMKPTHGLVPYTGVMPIESTIDHTGPMTSTVADNALVLEVIAGADGLDPRQYDVRVDKYTSALGRGVNGLRIAIVKEGFNHPNSDSDVDQKVRSAADKFEKLGAIVQEVSVPIHLDGPAIWTPIALEGLQAQMMNGNGMGFNWKGMYTTSLLDAHANWRDRANELSRTLKVSMFIGEYFIKEYRGHFYSKSQNLARLLKKSYNKIFEKFDLLLMPTTAMKATPLPPIDAPLNLWCQRAFESLANTAPFDVTGHPAMNVPCGLSNGLPVGMMLVGRHYEESVIYKAAYSFEQLGDWRSF